MRATRIEPKSHQPLKFSNPNPQPKESWPFGGDHYISDMSQAQSTTCAHVKLTFDPSAHAASAGYKHPPLAQRVAATTPRGTHKASSSDVVDPSVFPAPLVLPRDELSYDADCPPQSLRSWIREKDRNKVTPERRTVYFMRPPEAEPGVGFIDNWKVPTVKGRTGEKAVGFPRTEDVLGYLKAFYHGLPVKMLPSPHPCFTADVNDDDDIVEIEPSKVKGFKNKVAEKSPTLWLNTHTSSGCIGIRSRATPEGAFTHQLNLNDLLDAAMEILPTDAFALLMLVEHDIFEDEDDDFACGRAYGGSRIAVVSGARYNPILDKTQRLERNHAWPASHCTEYLERCCEKVECDAEERMATKKIKIDSAILKELKTSPMQAAVSSHLSLGTLDHTPSVAVLSGLWLGRVCRTASHELGHCFGIEHCVYYACSMQGTASVIEDARQPPYLCPVDLAKVLRATGADEKQRYEKLLDFCEKNRNTHLFAAFSGWIRGRLETV